MGGMSGMGGMSSVGGFVGYGGMGDIGAMGGMGAPLGGFMDSMVAHMPSMLTTNDGFVPSLIHSTHAHTSKIANGDETKDADAKDDGEGDED
nr:uncharacterized protein OsI_027940-like [Lolium perenne]